MFVYLVGVRAVVPQEVHEALLDELRVVVGAGRDDPGLDHVDEGVGLLSVFISYVSSLSLVVVVVVVFSVVVLVSFLVLLIIMY